MALDLVQIGFEVEAKGLEEANRKIDKLIDKFSRAGTAGEDAANNIGKAQEKAAKSADNILKKQQLLGEFLPDYKKSTAGLLANFRMMENDVDKLRSLLEQVYKNDSIESYKKQQQQLIKQQQQQTNAVSETLEKMRINAELAGKGFSASEQSQLRALQLAGATNTQMQQAIELIKKKRQAEDEATAALKKQQEVAAKAQKVKDVVQGFESKSQKSFGGGVLDLVNENNSKLSAMRDYYKELERLDVVSAEKRRVAEMQARQKEYQESLALEEKRRVSEMKARQESYLKSQPAAPAQQGGQWKNMGDPSSLKAFADQAKQTQDSYDSLLGTIGNIAKYALLSTAIYAVMNAFSALTGAIVTMADEYTAIQNRLKLYIKDSAELADVNQFAAKASIQNNVGLRETATLFTRLVPAMKSIGANTAATKTVVDAFGKSMRIGGATLREAEAATIQFSQAMASGKLAGDEFRSISEASPRFLKAIADGSGIAASKLKEMSAAGQLTTEVISRALIKEYAKLVKESDSLGYTLEQGTNALKVGFMSLIGEFNEGAGITQYLGSKLAELGLSMIDGVKDAKQAGADFKALIISMKEEFEVAFEIMKFAAIALSSFMLGKFVVSIAAAVASTVSGLATMAVASKAYFTAMSMEAGKAAASITIVGTAAKSASLGLVGLFGGGALGVIGLVATIAGIAGSYLLMKKNTEDATKELALQGAAANKTKEQLVALKGAQLATEKKDLAAEFAIQNAELNRYNTLIGNTVAKIYSQNTANKEAADVLKGVRTGTMSYNEALEKLNTMKGVNPDFIKELQDQITKYEEVRAAATKNAESQGFLGTAVTLMGNRLQNSLPFLNDFRSGIKGIGDEADLTGSKVNKFLDDLNKDTTLKKITAILMRRDGLSRPAAEKLANIGYDRVAGGAKVGLKSGEIAAAKRNDAAGNVISEIEKARSASDKLQNKAEKNSQKVKENYEDQVKEVVRLRALIAQNVDYEVAMVAAQKDYAENIVGTGLALEVVQAKWAKARLDAAYAQGMEQMHLNEINKLADLGVDMELARLALSNKFSANEEGLDYIEHVRQNRLANMTLSIADQLRYQNSINASLAKGLTMDEAKAVILADSIKTQDKTTKTMKSEILSNLKSLELSKAKSAAEEQFNQTLASNALYAKAIASGITAQTAAIVELKAKSKGMTDEAAYKQAIADNAQEYHKETIANSVQLNSLLTYTDALVGEVAAKYAFLNDTQRANIVQQRKLLDLAKARAAYEEDKKTKPILDTESLDFSIFGDLGDPFQAAFEGANSYVAVMKELGKELAVVETAQKAAVSAMVSFKGDESSSEYKKLTDEVKNLGKLEEYIAERRKQKTEESFLSGVKAAKNMVGENSKAYKVLTGIEKAFTIFKMAQGIKRFAVSMGFITAETGAYVAGSVTKKIAEAGFTAFTVVQKGIQAAASGVAALASSMAGLPFPLNIAAFAATAGLLASIGLNLAGGSKPSGSFEAANEGTGTVFGDKEAKSESIKKSIELLADNSRVELPLTAAMLKSLRNIENNIGGLTNLLIRNPPAEGLAASIGQGFKMDGIGKGITGAFDWVNKLTFGLADMFTLGLFSAFGKLLGGAFGKKVSIKGQGLYGGSQDLGGIVTDGFNLQEYVDIQTKKKSFGITTSTKNSTRYSKADQELANQFGLIFKNFYDTILMAASPLDQNLNEVTTKLNNFVVKIGKINLQGLSGEKIQEKLEAIFGAAADNIARAAISGLDDFQKVGEGYFETLIRVATGIESATAYTSRLNVTAIKYTDIINKQGDVTTEIIRQSVLLSEGYKGIAGGFYDMVDAFDGGSDEITDFVLQLRDLQDAIYATGKNGDYLTTSMFLGAGGMERLSSGLEAYFEMLSPAEQAAELTRRLTNEFALFGLQLPDDVKAFRNLVSSIDITSASGQKLYGQVIALAPEFNDLQDSLESANSEVNALVKSLRDLAEEARKARGETDQPRNLQAIRTEFDYTASLAMQGDTVAAEKLLTLGKDLMQVSKQYSVSGAEYSRDLATIQKVATVSADVQELGLGYTPTASLTPLATSGTQTVETVNASTDAKLEALRDDLVTAITAVAKYTQDTAQRLQRWDYGDKMTVRVEQDVGDAPVKVQTV